MMQQQPLLPLDPLTTQVVLNVVMAWLLEKIKNSPLVPLLDSSKPKLNRFMAIVASGLTALGVHLTTAHPDTGTYVITVTGITGSGLATSAFHWLKSFIFQEIAYQKLIKSTPQPAQAKG